MIYFTSWYGILYQV